MAILTPVRWTHFLLSPLLLGSCCPLGFKRVDANGFQAYWSVSDDRIFHVTAHASRSGFFWIDGKKISICITSEEHSRTSGLMITKDQLHRTSPTLQERSPDGEYVALVALQPDRPDIESAFVAASLEDRSTWIQLIEWGALEIRRLEWIDESSLLVRGDLIAEFRDPPAMRSTADGVAVRYEIRHIR